MKFLPCYSGEWGTYISSPQQWGIGFSSIHFSLGKRYWQFNRNYLYQLGCEQKCVEIHWNNGLTEEKSGGIYLGLGNPRQASRHLQPKQETAHPQLCHTNASGGDINNKWSMRHIEIEPSYKLQKYVFHSVLYSFVLNDATDGGTFFQVFGEARLRFQSREVFLLFSLHLFWLLSIFWLSVIPSWTKKPVQLHASHHHMLSELGAFCRWWRGRGAGRVTYSQSLSWMIVMSPWCLPLAVNHSSI